jgi:hypothetical protein
VGSLDLGKSSLTPFASTNSRWPFVCEKSSNTANWPSGTPRTTAINVHCPTAWPLSIRVAFPPQSAVTIPDPEMLMTLGPSSTARPVNPALTSMTASQTDRRRLP